VIDPSGVGVRAQSPLKCQAIVASSFSNETVISGFAAMSATNTSSDLIWEITRSQNSFLVNRKTGGGVRFSRDPLNLLNVHSRKYAGYVNDKAVGVQPSENGGVSLISKTSETSQHPTKNIQTITWAPHAPSRKIYKAVASRTAKTGYRADLREAAVARASALRRAQRPKKTAPQAKLRGAKAKKAAAKES
jgi:large subunit ribosomal protein L28e